MKRMMALAGLVVALMAVDTGGSGSGTIGGYDVSAIVTQVKPAVYRVIQFNPAGQIYGGGSGSIVSPDGYGYTNFHVVTSSKSVQVDLDDGTSCPAKVVGTNVKVDFGLLKIECPGRTTPYPYVKLADSNAVQKNEVSFAIGSPGDSSFVRGQFGGGGPG